MTKQHSVVGVFSDEGPPVPIPNTEVKLISADNTWLEAAREDKAMPTQYHLSNLRWLNSLKCLNSSVFDVSRGQKKKNKFALIAQSVEHAAVNRGVTGSSPV